MGALYRRGQVWWIKYYVNGRPVRESTGVAGDDDTPPAEAKRLLKVKEGKAAAGEPILRRADRVRFDEVEQDLRRHYEATGSRNLREYTYRVAHLTRFFAGRRIGAIGQADVDAYTVKRQAAGITGSTVRRELNTLTTMLRLAYENGKLLRLPILHKPREGAPREGFFERDQYEAVRRHLPPDLQLATAIAYTFGWRMQSEVLTLARRQVDLEAGTLRLEPGTTKNGDGRVVHLTPELKTLLTAHLERVRALEKRTGRIIPHLFPHLTGQRRLGTLRHDIRKAWRAACRAGGVPGRLVHDFRRTAARNMVNAGVPERVAMKVTGHRSRSVFDRYHIVSPADLQDVARRLSGTITGTVTIAPVTPPAQVREI